MKFSFIIPTYNYAKYLPHCLDSIFKQEIDFHTQTSNLASHLSPKEKQPTHEHEIIVVNDGSTDNTQAILDDYQQRYPKQLTVIHQSNRGVSAARNAGIKVAKGDYYWFLDSDDRLLPDAIGTVKTFLRQHPHLDVIFGGSTRVYPNGRVKRCIPGTFNTDPHRNFLRAIRNQYSIPTGCGIFKCTLFDQYHYSERITNCEDGILLLSLIANTQCGSFNEPIVAIYKHSHSLRHNLDKNLKTGLHVIEELFNSAHLPVSFSKYKQEYKARRYLDLFRSFYLAGQKKAARTYFYQAVYAYWPCIFNKSSITKYLRSWI